MKRLAALAAAALIAAVGVFARDDAPSPQTVASAPSAPSASAAPVDIDLAKLERPQSAAPASDPFAPKSFAPPAPAQPGKAVARAAAPSAPPLPFQYFGKWVADGVAEVFVMRGEELISVAEGRTIDGEYRVDAVTPKRIAFTYLPLKTRQSLELEEAGG
jgi:hypothetical protein